jgi:hypothetical protein
MNRSKVRKIETHWVVAGEFSELSNLNIHTYQDLIHFLLY